MPKVKKRLGKSLIKQIVRVKFRIGNRENGKSALGMKNAELLEVIEKSSRPRDKQLARNELAKRGVEIPAPVVEAA